MANLTKLVLPLFFASLLSFTPNVAQSQDPSDVVEAVEPPTPRPTPQPTAAQRRIDDVFYGRGSSWTDEIARRGRIMCGPSVRRAAGRVGKWCVSRGVGAATGAGLILLAIDAFEASGILVEMSKSSGAPEDRWRENSNYPAYIGQ